MIRTIKWLIVIGIFLATIDFVPASDLNHWIKSKIQEDERILVDALKRRNGYTIEGLNLSKWYMPFFLDPLDEASNKRPLSELLPSNNSIVPGGYIIRLRFDDAQPFYILSGGGFEKNWYNPRFQAEIEIGGNETWAGKTGDKFSYATFIRARPPRFVKYDQAGEVKEEKVFTTINNNEIDSALDSFSDYKKPIVETITLAEYLREDKPKWRPAAYPHIRGQSRRKEENDHVANAQSLTRKQAIQLLSEAK